MAVSTRVRRVQCVQGYAPPTRVRVWSRAPVHVDTRRRTVGRRAPTVSDPNQNLMQIRHSATPTNSGVR